MKRIHIKGKREIRQRSHVNNHIKSTLILKTLNIESTRSVLQHQRQQEQQQQQQKQQQQLTRFGVDEKEVFIIFFVDVEKVKRLVKNLDELSVFHDGNLRRNTEKICEWINV